VVGTGGLCRLSVDGRDLFAKYSLLGTSLVSLLRGSCGGWDVVRRAQHGYAASPGPLLAREAAQLRLLAELGHPRVHAVAGARRGVLFTSAVSGPTLAELILECPEATAELLASAFTQLDRLHHLPASGRDDIAVISERGIAGTFLRKFSGPGTVSYVAALLGTRDDRPADEARAAQVQRTLTQLTWTWSAAMAVAEPQPMLVYGDLKPEHVLYPDGRNSPSVFLDPGMHSASIVTDLAKLVSRTLLIAVTSAPHPSADQIIAGVDAFVHARLAASASLRADWLHELLALWMMDAANIISTCLSAPDALPLPGLAVALRERAWSIWPLLDRISDALTPTADPHAVWELAMAETAGIVR